MEVDEVEIFSLIEEQIPKYRIRADNITSFAGTSNQDFEFVQFPALNVPENINLGLTSEQARETLNYFCEYIGIWIVTVTARPAFRARNTCDFAANFVLWDTCGLRSLKESNETERDYTYFSSVRDLAVVRHTRNRPVARRWLSTTIIAEIVRKREDFLLLLNLRRDFFSFFVVTRLCLLFFGEKNVSHSRTSKSTTANVASCWCFHSPKIRSPLTRLIMLAHSAVWAVYGEWEKLSRRLVENRCTSERRPSKNKFKMYRKKKNSLATRWEAWACLKKSETRARAASEKWNETKKCARGKKNSRRRAQFSLDYQRSERKAFLIAHY